MAVSAKQLQDARRKAEKEAREAGVDPSTIDPSYVRALASGQERQYIAQAQRTGRSRNRNATVTPTNPTQIDLTRRIEDLYEQRREQLLQDIERQEAGEISALRRLTPGIQRQARQARQQTDIEAIQSEERLREQLAQAGLARSGANVTAQLGLQAARQEQLGGITQQEQDALDRIQSEIANIRRQAEVQRQAGLAGISAQEQQALLQEEIQAPQRALQAALQQEQLAQAQLQGQFLPQQLQLGLSAEQEALRQAQLQGQFLPQRLELGLQSEQEALRQAQLQGQFLPRQLELGLQAEQEALRQAQLRGQFLPQQLQLGLDLQQRQIRQPYFKPTSALERQIQQEQLLRSQLQNEQLRQQIDQSVQPTATERANQFRALSDQVRETVTTIRNAGGSQQEIDREILGMLEVANFQGVDDEIIINILNQYGLQ